MHTVAREDRIDIRHAANFGHPDPEVPIFIADHAFVKPPRALEAGAPEHTSDPTDAVTIDEALERVPREFEGRAENLGKRPAL